MADAKSRWITETIKQISIQALRKGAYGEEDLEDGLLKRSVAPGLWWTVVSRQTRPLNIHNMCAVGAEIRNGGSTLRSVS